MRGTPPLISTRRVTVRVIRTDEELMIARSVSRVLGLGSHSGDVRHDHYTLTPELLRRMDAYWRAANYLSVGQIYLTTTRC